MAVKLKPCPFCGSLNVRAIYAPDCWVKCMDCGAGGPERNSTVEAAESWNGRINMRLIDADALFDRVYDKYGESLDEGPANMFMDWINEAPTIDPESLQPQWIPVTERLPERRGNYLVTCSGINADGGKYRSINHYDGDGKWTEDATRLRGDTVLAWMPLPEPYKGEHDD